MGKNYGWEKRLSCALRLELGRFHALLPGGLKPQTLPRQALDGVSLLILNPADLKAAALPDWQALGIQDLEVDQTGWVHIQTDGSQMWLEQGK